MNAHKYIENIVLEDDNIFFLFLQSTRSINSVWRSVIISSGLNPFDVELREIILYLGKKIQNKYSIYLIKNILFLFFFPISN